MAWLRLIRFEDENGTICFGEPEIHSAEELPTLLESGQLYAHEISGSSPFQLSTEMGTRKKVKSLRAILEPSDVPIIKCVGLNYMKHSK